MAPWNKIYKTTIIQDNDIKFAENLKYEDTPFVAIALDKAKRIGKINEALIYYQIHESSETTTRDEKCLDIINVVDIVREYYDDKDYIQDEANKFIVKTLTNYTIQQREVEKNIREEFIDRAFAYLEEYVPNYKNNKYYKSRGILKRTIEKNIKLTKLYCDIYYKIKNK